VNEIIMLSTKHKNGFTLVELLVALVVTSIVLVAITTFAFALGSANEVTGDTSQKQAQIRSATLRIQELIRHSKLVCAINDDDIAIWYDDNNNDGHINIGEIVYIERGSNRDHINICNLMSSDGLVIELDAIGAISTNWWSAYDSNIDYILVIPECSNVRFEFDSLPPHTKFVSISFDIIENNAIRQYQINAALRGWAGNMLDDDDSIIDDDD